MIEKRIIDIFKKYIFNVTNQAGNKYLVIEEDDFEKIAAQIIQQTEAEKNELIEALITRVSTDFVYVKSGEINIEDITGDIDILEEHTGKSIEELLNEM